MMLHSILESFRIRLEREGMKMRNIRKVAWTLVSA